MSDPWWNSWTRAWWIIGNHAKVDLAAARTEQCTYCSQLYDSYELCDDLDDTRMTLAWDMAAMSREIGHGRWAIHCGYGSDFDMKEFWFIRDFPTVPSNAICDWCIRRMLHHGIIIDSGKDAG